MVVGKEAEMGVDTPVMAGIRVEMAVEMGGAVTVVVGKEIDMDQWVPWQPLAVGCTPHL